LDNEEGVYLPDRKRPIPFASVNQQDRSGRTLIFKYASRGDVDSTEALLKAGASLRIADYAGWTPLHEACLEGHTDIVRLMLAFDADVDSPGGDGDTPLHDAVGNVHYDVVKLLLQHGASIDLVNEQGQTALEFANEKLQESNIEYAANDYESPSKRNEAKLENEDAKKIYDLLLDWKDMTTKIVQRDSSGQTMLHHACAKGENDKVLELLQYGSDISAQDATGWSPLHNAALQGHADVVETLLRYGADVDACGFEDETPLHDAVANGHIQCASLLLQYGAEPFRKNKNGKMAKDLVSHGNHAMMELLEYPLDHWQPLKTREFYARLLTPCDPEIIQERKKKQKTGKAQSAVKKHSQKAAKHQSQNKNFAWGGLDSRAGPFESSREEKKFRALWQSIAKQDTEPTKPPTRESPVLGRPRQSSVDPVKPKVDTKKRSSVPPEETPTKKPKKYYPLTQGC
jgi:ankyrin repeat protein